MDSFGGDPWLGVHHNGELSLENGTEWQSVYSLSDTTVNVQDNSCDEYAWMCGTVAVESFQHGGDYDVVFQVGLIDEKIVKWYAPDPEYSEYQWNGLFLNIHWEDPLYYIWISDYTSSMMIHTTTSPSFDFKMQIYMCGDPNGQARVKVNDGTGWTAWSGWFTFDADWLDGYTDVDFSQAHLAKVLCEWGSNPVCNTTYRGTANFWLWIQTNQSWFDHCSYIYPALTGLQQGPLGGIGVYVCPDQFATLLDWTGIACGKFYYFDPIHMDGPYCTNLEYYPEWGFVYKLYVDVENSYEPLWVPPQIDPPTGAEGWYPECTTVNLTAPLIHPIWNWPGLKRYVFDYWELDGTPVPDPSLTYTADNATLHVHMDKNHTAIVYYKRQSWICINDNINNQSGIYHTGAWYDCCTNYTFTAPDIVYPLYGDPGMRGDFRWWQKSPDCFTLSGPNVGNTPSITIHIDHTFDGVCMVARYQGQYRLLVETNPAFIDSITLDPPGGWYDPGATVNMSAPPEHVITPDCSKWVFDEWKVSYNPMWSHSGLWWVTTMTMPKNFTAHYKLMHKLVRQGSPGGLSYTGPPLLPHEVWKENGTNTWFFKAPDTDDTGVFQFKNWEIDGVPYPDGDKWIAPYLVTGCHVGTAYYVNQTAWYTTPSEIYRDAHSEGYCTKFNITVMAANFDVDRIVNGQSMGIYAMDFKLNFNTTLLEVQDVYLHLDDFWAEAPEGYFIAKNEVDNASAIGTYWLSATVKGDHPGFSGTRPVVTLTFHVMYSPCWPNEIVDAIWFCELTLLNGNGTEHGDPHEIFPEYAAGTWYTITPPQPEIVLVDANDGDNHVIVHKNVPQTTFDVEVWLLYGIKVKDFNIKIEFNASQVDVLDVMIGTYLKPPYQTYSWHKWYTNMGTYWKGTIRVQVVQEGPPQGAPLQNCSGILFTVRFKVVEAIYYHLCGLGGPKQLHSWINTTCDSYISVKCPTPRNIDDLVLTNLAYTYNPQIGDVDFDGCVTVLDLQLVADHYNTGLYDITGDGNTDIMDLVVVAINFGKCAPPPG
jgi:hypothetical protein